MRKFLTFFLTALLAFGVGWAGETVVFDFTSNSWGLPVGSANITRGENSYSNGVYTITLSAPTGSGYSNHGYYYNSVGYLMICRNGSKLVLPAFDKNVVKIDVVGRSGASSSVQHNIFVGNTGICSTATGATGTSTFEIPEEYQAAGTIYESKVLTSASNQITKVIVYFAEGDTPQKDDVTLSFSESTCNATIGQTFIVPTLTVDPIAAASEIVYSSSNEDVATVDNNGNVTLLAAGTTTITAAISDNETYKDASVSYTLTVTDPYKGILDFTKTTGWNPSLPTSSTNVTGSYYDGTAYTVELAGSGYYQATSSGHHYLLLGKQGAYLQFPAFDKPVKKFEIVGRSGASTATKQNIFVGDVAVSEETTDATQTHEYEIDEDYQAAGTIYTLKVTNDKNTQIQKIYIYFGESVPEPDPLTVTLTPAPEQPYTVGDNVTVYATVGNGNDDTMVTYKVNGGNDQEYTATGIVLPNTTAGDVVVTVYATDGDQEATDTVTYHFNAAQAFAITLTPDGSEEYTVGDKVNVKVGVQNNIGEDLFITYSINRAEETYDPTKGIDITRTTAGDVTLTVNVTDGYDHLGESSKEATYTFHAAGPIQVVLDPAQKTYNVGDEAKVKVNITGVIGEYITECLIDGEEASIDDNGYISLPNDKADTLTVTVTVVDGYEHAAGGTATGTYIFKKIDAALSYTTTEYNIVEGDEFTAPTLTNPNDLDVNYVSNNEAVATVDEDGNVTITGVGTAIITASYEGNNQYTDGQASYTINVTARPVVSTPTFSPVPGSYTSAQTVTINCATQGATIKYSTDGGNSWNEGNTVNVDKDMTIQVMAEEDGMTASSATATYVIDIPEVKPTMEPIDGYFKVMNNGNQKFVNVAGRKTITFANEANIDKMAGTVVYLKTDEHGQVQSLRSQAADLQGYADRAMRYVPEIVQMAVDKLHAEGTGEILGNEGLDSIMAKFDECFDHHLYVEAAEGGYRLYGKTPSMQHVVDFYRDHKDKVEAKLPQLEAFINSAIEKVLEKTGGRGASILQPFSLLETWQRMDSALVDADLIKPVDEATTMDFYRQVLNNKKYVWAFAYETAMTYWERLKNNQTFIENKDKLGEFAQYIDKIEQIRPDFKYYIVQDNNQIDYISEGNVDINNNQPRTVWTLTPRDKFTVNFDSNMTMDDRLYYTTLYTDFAYNLPEGVKAYKVTKVNNNGVGAIEALEGTIPAQTPVLLKSNAAGDVELTIAAAGNADVTGNLLVGADYFINTYEIKTPQVEGMFNMVATVFGENSSFYQELLNKYGYLMIKTSGTVNNKYFWALSNDDLKECVVENELGEEDCVVRTLGKDEDGIGFYSEWTAPINQAFLASDKFNPVKLLLGKDVTRDGLWNVVDVTATISIVLGTAPENNNYDYDAADFDNSGRINVADVTAMIAYILGK